MRYFFNLLLAAGIVLLSFNGNVLAGDLEPQNSPDSTMKTLDQVQPCIPIQSLSGDSASMYIINESGSYYLAGNITGGEGKRGITVQADNVTIDLKGFS